MTFGVYSNSGKSNMQIANILLVHEVLKVTSGITTVPPEIIQAWLGSDQNDNQNKNEY